MNLTYTPTTPPQPNPGYTIYIECEHGDADITTHETVSVSTEPELVKFITAFGPIAAAIEKSATSRYKVSAEERDAAEAADIPLVWDKIYDGVYARMYITKIQFVNSDGVEYIVTY